MGGQKSLQLTCFSLMNRKHSLGISSGRWRSYVKCIFEGEIYERLGQNFFGLIISVGQNAGQLRKNFRSPATVCISTQEPQKTSNPPRSVQQLIAQAISKNKGKRKGEKAEIFISLVNHVRMWVIVLQLFFWAILVPLVTTETLKQPKIMWNINLGTS